MYKIKYIEYLVNDTPSNLLKLFNHSNILIKEFKDAELFWTTVPEKYYSTEDYIPYYYNTTTKLLSAYIKIKHSRRYKEIDGLWAKNVKDIMSIIK